MEINISEAKAQLSKLINLAYHGEKIVICKNNLPLVDLVRHKPEGKRKLGLLAGKFVTPPSIFEADHEIEEMFYGNDWCFMEMTQEATAGHPCLFVGSLWAQSAEQKADRRNGRPYK